MVEKWEAEQENYQYLSFSIAAAARNLSNVSEKEDKVIKYKILVTVIFKWASMS